MATGTNAHGPALNRRDILRGGGTLAVAAALVLGAPPRLAQAQA